MAREEREEAIEYIKKFRELDAKLYQTVPFATVSKNALTKCLRYWDVAIEALSAEPCEDCISRQAVLDDLERSHITSGVRNQGTWNECIDSMMRTVKSMPSVTPKQETVTEFADRCRECGSMIGRQMKQKMGRWIPVSERLPELGEKVLCQCQAGIYEVLKLTVNGWYFDIDHCYMESFVIAWMPLPEPFKAESEEQNE